MENNLRKDLERQLEESLTRMKEYEKEKFHEQQAMERSNYIHIVEKIKELDEKEKYEQVLKEKEEHIQSLKEKIEVLQKKLKESADRMAQYRKEGSYDQQMIEHTNYNHILTQIAELKKQTREDLLNIKEQEQKTKIESIPTPKIEPIEPHVEKGKNVEELKKSPEPSKPKEKLQEEKPNPIESSSIQQVKEQPKPKETSNPLETIKNVQIVIGRKAKVTINSREYQIGKELVKEGCELDSKEVFMILKDMGLEYDYEEIKSLYDKAMLDPVVINVMNEVEQEECEVKDIVSQYIQDIIAADEGKDFQNRCHIIYDEKDIGKASIKEALKRRINSSFHRMIFREKEIDTYDKKSMLYCARTVNRFNLVKIQGEKKDKLPAIGEYKPSLLGKISEWIAGERGWGDEVYFLPKRTDMMKVAQLYDKLKQQRNLSRINSERWMRRYALTQEQEKELRELYESENNKHMGKNKRQEWTQEYVNSIKGFDKKVDDYLTQEVSLNSKKATISEEELQQASDRLEEKWKEESR